MKKVLAGLMLMASVGVAQAGTGILDTVLQTSDGSTANAYDFGTLTFAPKVLSVSIANPLGANCAPFCGTSLIDEHANFVSLTTGAMAVSFSLTSTLGNINNVEIENLSIALWDDVHPNGSSLLATFSGNNVTNFFTLTAGTQYHFDISGNFGTNATHGQYSIAIAAIPEPSEWALMLSGLGLMGFMARRRRNASQAV